MAPVEGTVFETRRFYPPGFVQATVDGAAGDTEVPPFFIKSWAIVQRDNALKMDIRVVSTGMDI